MQCKSLSNWHREQTINLHTNVEVNASKTFALSIILYSIDYSSHACALCSTADGMRDADLCAAACIM